MLSLCPRRTISLIFTKLSMNVTLLKFKANVILWWRFTTNQFALSPSPLRITTTDFFSWTLAIIVLIWRGDGFVSYEYAWPFVKCTYRTYSTLLKILPFCITHKPSVSPGFAKQILPILRIICYNDSLFAWTFVNLNTAKFKPLIMKLKPTQPYFYRRIFSNRQ
jgi:hypothetical protein